MGIGEEKSDRAVETKLGEDSPISQIEENGSTVNIDSYEIPPIGENVNTLDTRPLAIPTEIDVEGVFFPRPCQQFDAVGNCSSKIFDTLCPYGEDVTIAVNSSSLLEFYGEVDNGGRNAEQVDCGSETKGHGLVASPIKEKVCTLDISSVGVVEKSAVGEPDIGAVDTCSRVPDMPDLSEEDLTVVYNSLECFGQIDNVGRDDMGVDSRPEIKCYGYGPSQILENVCALNTDSFGIATESVDICSSRRLDVLDLSVANNSGNSVECSEAKCSSIVPSSSRRSSRVHKAIGKTQTKNITRKCQKTTKVAYPDQSMEFPFNNARRKRSCGSKPARSSIWGVLGNVNQVFAENNDLVFSEVQSQELQKAKGSQGNDKRNKVRASENSKGSIKSSHASSSRIRLKVRLGNEVIQSCLNVMIPAVAHTSAPADGTTNEHRAESIFPTMPQFSNLINHVKDKMGSEVTEQHNSADSSVDCEGGTGEYGNEDLEVHLTDKNTDSSSVLEKSVGVTAGCYPGISSADSGGGINTGPGTSPDSEVINIVQDAEVGLRCQEDVHYSVLTSKGFSDLENVNCKRGNCIREDGSPGQEDINTAIPLNTCECGQKVGNGSDSRETTASFTTGDATISSEEYSTKPLRLSKEIEVEVCRNILKIEIDGEDKTSCSVDIGLGLPESLDSKNLLISTKTKGHKLSKCSKSGGGSKGRSKDSDSARSRKGNASRKRENQRKSGNEIEATKTASDEAVCKADGPPETGNNMVNDLGVINTIEDIGSVNMFYLDAVSSGFEDQILPQRKAWVCCDDCHKWRRIPAALADSLGENSRWICKDSMDKAFADCSTPQEKSNAEINAELELSEASGEEDATDGRKHFKDLESRPSKVLQPASFTCIPHNEYLHRSRKSQTIDEIMVCHCRPSFDGQMGCGDECLNRMLNIECVRGTCPCGDLCSNQQFQKREYAGMHWFATGKKGYGLQLLDNVSKGQFLIEYIGEVLDINAYDTRQKKYASDGHKHFYFMTLNGSEVIDASAKGNIGRFINHSCDPNCRTEKWMVNGEICIGLFALRDMKKGEEVTFDYNYVRVFGAAAKKCYCGSLQCQGYIGGDPSNTEVIVQGDSDEEFPEPVMLFENGKRRVRLKNKVPRTKRTQKEESVLKARNKIDESTTDVVQLQITTQFDDSLNRVAPVVSELHCSPLQKLSISGPEEVSAQTEDVTSSLISYVQEELPMEDDPLKNGASFSPMLDTSTAKLSKLLPDAIAANRKSKSETLTQRTSSKLGHHMKISRSSSSVTKGKVNSDSLKACKSQVTPDRSELQQSIKTPANSFESVEVKLNELLDGDGGISKRKDAPKGYLKLLLLTAASGNSGNGEAIQSNRELSMILDALLKTKSRIALIDIINKNGLRMLHNIMKQYRRDFKKIPILRKLLKVLEYLAVREILTQEHINGGPPCPGMESFTESMLSLTVHDDKQVHQIARSFRDKWIPRHLRKLGYMDIADGRDFLRGSSYNRFSASPNFRHDSSPRPPQATDCVKQATPVAAPVAFSGIVQEGSSAECTGGSSLSTGTKIRKRKSRWDQPADINKNTSGLVQSQSQQDQSSLCGDGEKNDVLDDFPPGFSSCGSKSPSIYLPQAKVNSLDCPKLVVGQQQERFISCKPVSYGIPLSIVKQFGSLQAEFPESWTVAPGIPFYPFPPLPQNNKNALDPMSTDQAGACAHPANPGTTPAIPGAKLEHPFKRVRDPIDLGKRYFRQQKWSNPKIPPWLWQRNNSNNGRGFGNQMRNGVCSSDVGVGNEYINTFCSEGVNCSRVEKPGNDCYQPQQIQNHPRHH